MIDLLGIHFSYPDGRGAVLENFNLHIATGDKLALVGDNGTGKTTVLQILNGLRHPRRGQFRFEGDAVTRRALRREDFRRRFRSRVVYLFPQSDVMLFNQSVFDELAFTARLLGMPDVHERVTRWAEIFGLTDLLPAYPFHLSEGERRRVCLAALFSLDPDVVLLDEPEADIDAHTTEVLVELLAEPRLTVVMATHNSSLRDAVCGREVQMKQSRSGPTDHRAIPTA